ncbi:MAG: glycosyltransferase [bacterium]|nr:glycosyltransferase [bacterium]
MKILFAAMKYDYGIPERGFSFEHYNFYDTLSKMGYEIDYFDFMSLYQQFGSQKMTKMLRGKVDEWKPDLLFTFLYTDQFDTEELKKIKTETSTVTFNWFADDHWRFDSFSKYLAPCFSFVSTTDKFCLPKYKEINYKNVLLTQWGVNHFLYRKRSLPLKYDVSFIGQAHGDRLKIIGQLKKKGIHVVTKGTAWDVRFGHRVAKKLHFITGEKYNSIVNRSRISQEEMIDLFQQSAINLNFTDSSHTSFQNQIKGRNFEIPGCGGFQLSQYVEGLDEFFIPDKEIVLFKSLDELIEKIVYYLLNEHDRSSIAEAGYQKVIRDHTYERRFNELFYAMGLL